MNFFARFHFLFPILFLVRYVPNAYLSNATYLSIENNLTASPGFVIKDKAYRSKIKSRNVNEISKEVTFLLWTLQPKEIEAKTDEPYLIRYIFCGDITILFFSDSRN